MLRDLHVRNLAVLAEAAVEFGPGLNVLTGETGAGKSIVVDSLALLAGVRASSELIRQGTELLTVTGVFEPAGEAWRRPLETAGVEPRGDELVVRREVSRAGRNRVFLDDQPVTLGLLAEVAPLLLRIHTQRDELGLLSAEQQRQWLDRSAGDEGAAAGARVAAAFEAWSALEARLARLQGDQRLRQERIDLLRFQASEIDRAAPVAGEEEELRAERRVLRNVEAIGEALEGSLGWLFEEDGAAVERLSQAERALDGIAEWEPEAPTWGSRLRELRLELQEIADALRDRRERLEADPRRLDQLEERLAVLERLLRKYGPTTAEVLEQRRAIAAELEELEGDAANRDELESGVAAALGAYRRAASELSARRQAWGRQLCEAVHRELAELAMKRARFAVGLARRRRQDSPLHLAGEPVEFGPWGYDQVVFELTANPGEAAQPLARAASGGELSRVYLALQLAVRGEGEAAATSLVFDEVDAGIGGAEAAALGRKLKRLARGGQVLAVTHLPQVASHADRHFRVSKRVAGGRTRTAVERLDETGRIEEVARMLAGRKVTPLSRSHAEELIAVAGRSV